MSPASLVETPNYQTGDAERVDLGCILVVDDDIGICTLERMRLERAGYRVVTASSAAEVDNLLALHDVDLLVLDNRLPGEIDGLELYRRLQVAGHVFPVIMVTGFSDEATVIEALKSGVRDFITKSDAFLDVLPESVERIMKQIRVERALAESEARYRKLNERFQGIFRSSKDAIGYSSLAGELLEVNDAFERLTGYTRAELLTLSYQDLTPPEYHASQAERVRQVQRTGIPTEIEKEYLHKDGTRIPVAVTIFLVQDSQGQPAGLAGIVKDISDRKRAEQALREKESHIRVIVEHMPAIFFSVDQDFQITRCVGAGLAALNLAPNQLKGVSLFEYVRTNDPSCSIIAACRRALQGESLSLEVEWQGRFYHDHLEPLRGTDGAITECIGIALDITELRLFQKHSLRSERLESLGTLAGGIAHDLNNVLTPIVMAIDLLRMRCTDATTESLLNTLQTSAGRAADMVKQVLSYAHGSPGQTESLMLGSLVKEVAKFLTQTFPKSIDIRAEVEPNLPLVTANPTQVHQMLMNLCLNARDAMPGGGRLTISVATRLIQAPDACNRPDLKPGLYAVLTIEDTGTGIPAEMLDKIFDPFFTTKDPSKGTGLGLFNVAGIVKNHGGFLEVHSEVGQGTRFSIGLLALQVGKTSENSGKSTDLPIGRGQVILVVDDETAIRTLMERTLQASGYRVLGAGNGTEAIAQFTEHREEIQLVIIDLMMPGMDGISAAHALYALDPQVRVIVASGYQKNRSLQIPGFVKSVLTKPFTSHTVLSAVYQALPAPRE